MLRLLIWILVIAMLITLAGSVIQGVKQVLNAIKDGIAGFFGGIAEGIGNFFRGLAGYNSTITYVAEEGLEPPESQRFKGGSYPKLSEETPVRAGHHFIGWTRVQGGNEPFYFSGTRTAQTFEGDTTLYACWEAHDPQNPHKLYGTNGSATGLLNIPYNVRQEHKYAMQESENGKIIRIFCTCGMELVDRNIGLDAFVNLLDEKNTSFDALKEDEQKKLKRAYVLYCTQDFAPAAINLITAFYGSIDLEKQKVDIALSDAETIVSTLKDAAEKGAKIMENKADHEKVLELKALHYEHNEKGETLAYVLRSMTTDPKHASCRKLVKETFDELVEKSETAANAIGVGRALFYGYDMLANNSEGVLDKTQSMVKAVHAVVAFMPYGGDYYDQLFGALEEGLVLYEKCVENRDSYYQLLDSYLEDKELLDGMPLTVIQVDHARNGVFEVEGRKSPTVMEVLDALIQPSSDPAAENIYKGLSEKEKTLVVWYLTMRLEYDFQQQYQISLAEYKAYFEQ